MAHALVRFRKQNNGMSQEQLAEMLGCHRLTVVRWETGKRRPSPQQVIKIAERTGIPAHELRPDLARLMERG